MIIEEMRTINAAIARWVAHSGFAIIDGFVFAQKMEMVMNCHDGASLGPL